MKVIFTDYDTVKIGTEDEMTTKKFFKVFEYLIKNGEVTNCNYNSKNEEFSYLYDNKEYTIKITNKSINKLRNLLSLTKLEQNEDTKRKDARIRENVKAELLRKARKGEIVSEEAKQLYIKELKSEIKLSNIFKGFELQDFACDLFNLDVTDTEDWSGAISIVLIFISFISIIGSIILLFSEIIKIIPAIIMLDASFSEFFVGIATLDRGGSLVARALTYIIWGIINLVGNLIKINIDFVRAMYKFIPKINLIKHKIKSLEKCNLPIEEITLPKTNENSNVWSSYISKSIDNIYLNLLKLNDEDKQEIRKELETKLKEYKMALLNVPKSGLTLETEGTVNIEFIMYLAELELKINQKLNSQIKSNLITTSLERINEETEDNSNNKPKKRVLQK